MNIVIANGPGRLDNGREVILFPSRWDSAVPGKAPFKFYPYELGLLSSLLKRELPGAAVELVDGNLWGWDGDRYALELRKRKPDVLICELSALTYSTMTRVMRKVQPGCAILCGPMAHGDYMQRTHDDGWDWTVSGEYEAKVLGYLTNQVAAPGYIDLDWLPWPEDEDVPRIAYQEINHYRPGIVQMYATRGCPLACTFCVVPTYYGGHGHSHKSHRCRDVENVCDEIEYLAAKYGNQFNGCYFNEEAHNSNVEWLVSFCETLIRRNLNRFHYDAMCGAWPMTEELTAFMARAGYGHFRFGVESTSEVVGRAIKKTIHKDMIERLLGWLKQYGIRAYGTFQLGTVGSTEATDLATLEDLRRWRDAGLMQKWQVSTSVPQPGTPLHAQAKREGWLVTEDLDRYDGWQSVLNLPGYPNERINAVRQGAGL